MKHSVSDAIGNRYEWQQMKNLGHITTPPTYFIVLASTVKILEVKAIEIHRTNSAALFASIFLSFNSCPAIPVYIRPQSNFKPSNMSPKWIICL